MIDLIQLAVPLQAIQKLCLSAPSIDLGLKEYLKAEGSSPTSSKMKRDNRRDARPEGAKHQEQCRPTCVCLYGSDPIYQIGNDGGEADRSQAVSRELVVVSCDTPEILEAAETALDDVAPRTAAFAEAVDGDPV